LAFEPRIYDAERYESMLGLAAEMAATVNGDATLDPTMADALTARWRAEVVNGVPGYVTPKVGVGAIVFNEREELLLIKRPEGAWFFPTGWADIGYSAAQVAAKEVREETGLMVTPQRVIAIFDSQNWRTDLNPHFYSIVFYCRLDGGTLTPHPAETRGAGFFSFDNLPQPIYQNRVSQVQSELARRALAAHRGEYVETYFDP
jgi:ADP-ribose pyrophosphatase YjhB (NUDIX family)